MDSVAEPVPTYGTGEVEELARRILALPGLEDLNRDQLEALGRVAYGQRLVRDLDEKINLAGIDYEAEKATFLAQAGKTSSVHTRRTYELALGRLEAFAARRRIPVLELKARDADDFCYALAEGGRAPATVRKEIAAASSFFGFLERRVESVRSPFRGSKARPALRAARRGEYPSEEEAEKILDALGPDLRAAAAVMLWRGLRVGALPSLGIRAGRFTARSKGKELSGELPAAAREAIRRAGLALSRPFVDLSETKIADGIRRKTRRLAAEGKLAAAYSAHDLRHLYTVREYGKDHDIYRVSKLLGHASIQVTESYLKDLGEID